MAAAHAYFTNSIVFSLGQTERHTSVVILSLYDAEMLGSWLLAHDFCCASVEFAFFGFSRWLKKCCHDLEYVWHALSAAY
jgi:hypothetical protein